MFTRVVSYVSRIVTESIRSNNERKNFPFFSSLKNSIILYEEHYLQVGIFRLCSSQSDARTYAYVVRRLYAQKQAQTLLTKRPFDRQNYRPAIAKGKLTGSGCYKILKVALDDATLPFASRRLLFLSFCPHRLPRAHPLLSLWKLRRRRRTGANRRFSNLIR